MMTKTVLRRIAWLQGFSATNMPNFDGQAATSETRSKSRNVARAALYKPTKKTFAKIVTAKIAWAYLL
jgi:hypothetical protein